ncbi:hypothetical protein [Burkholderia mayonis]|uniref:hypothetical protein n=1 Tax=Burkholderia mayonis TaxID=1385591 RepID=UPI00131EFBA8|nr:hypothetical protein [Burkholderia mayonis]
MPSIQFVFEKRQPEQNAASRRHARRRSFFLDNSPSARMMNQSACVPCTNAQIVHRTLPLVRRCLFTHSTPSAALHWTLDASHAREAEAEAEAIPSSRSAAHDRKEN